MNNKPPNLKTTSTALLLVLLMTAASFMASPIQPVNAEALHTSQDDNGSIALPAGVTPDLTIKTDVYLSFRPNPVGKNQPILINLWNDPGPSYARYFKDYTVTITKPDETTETVIMDSYPADGTAWFEYIPDQVGTYKIKFDFLGGYFPAGNYTVPEGVSQAGYTETYTKSVYYLPDSTPEQTLTVQEEQVASWPSAALPTDYWTRPASPENREWYSILGDFPWRGPGGGPDWPTGTTTVWNPRGKFTPYVQAPNTAHIVWKQQGAISGLIGATQGLTSFTSGGGTPTIIFQGRGYQTISGVNPTGTNSQNYWRCYDIRTGEIYWERPIYSGESAPTLIEYSTGAAAVAGGGSDLGITATLLSISGTKLVKYNPYTGAVSTNVSIPSFTTNQYYMNGYVLSVQTIDASTYDYRLINWTTLGSSTNFASRIISNITYPLNTLGQFQDFETGICFVIREPNALDESGLNPMSGFPYVNIYVDGGTGIRHGMRIFAASLTTGKLLWNTTTDDEPYSSDQAPYSQSCNLADHGKLAVLTRKGYFNIYDQNTGKFLYKTETMDYPWDEPGFGAYDIATAYGNIYRAAYSGVYAFDWETGKTVWKYEAPTNPYETPYINENGTTVNAFYGSIQIADGKLYIQNTEHTPTQPITRGLKLHCIDAITGQGIWNITGCMTPGAIADGYLTASNSYDGYMYVFGKGQSQTTVSTVQSAITSGTSVIISGTVLDMSSAQEGTPCVSTESMSDWMEYLHMQHSIPSEVVGVPVSIDAVDPTGESTHLATVTSDMSGTFSHTWKPNMAGDYVITATFMGDESYGSSWAETHATVSNAPVTSTPTETTLTMPPFELYTLGSAIAIISAIAIAVLLLRKKP